MYEKSLEADYCTPAHYYSICGTGPSDCIQHAWFCVNNSHIISHVYSIGNDLAFWAAAGQRDRSHEPGGYRDPDIANSDCRRNCPYGRPETASDPVDRITAVKHIKARHQKT